MATNEEELSVSEATGRYKLGQILRQSPEKLSGGLVVCLNAAVTAEWIDMTKQTLGAINIIFTTVLTIFYITPNVVSMVKLDRAKKVQEEDFLKTVDLGKQLVRRPIRSEGR